MGTKKQKNIPSETIFILSIHPEYARKIWQGEKKVELRKSKPRIEKNALLLLYTTAPKKAITGLTTVEAVVKRPLQPLWEEVEGVTGGTQEDFFRYFQGQREGVAIFLGHLWPLTEPLSLVQIRELEPGFHPPQNYLYLDPEQFQKKWQQRLMERSNFPGL